MIPGEYRLAKNSIECNHGREIKTIRVANTGDRPIQVGSHFHFSEVNSQLLFPREDTIGMRLNIAASTAVRFEPGEDKEVELVSLGGKQAVYGLNGLTEGRTKERIEQYIQKAKSLHFKGVDYE